MTHDSDVRSRLREWKHIETYAINSSKLSGASSRSSGARWRANQRFEKHLCPCHQGTDRLGCRSASWYPCPNPRLTAGDETKKVSRRSQIAYVLNVLLTTYACYEMSIFLGRVNFLHHWHIRIPYAHLWLVRQSQCLLARYFVVESTKFHILTTFAGMVYQIQRLIRPQAPRNLSHAQLLCC